MPENFPFQVYTYCRILTKNSDIIQDNHANLDNIFFDWRIIFAGMKFVDIFVRADWFSY